MLTEVRDTLAQASSDRLGLKEVGFTSSAPFSPAFQSTPLVWIWIWCCAPDSGSEGKWSLPHQPLGASFQVMLGPQTKSPGSLGGFPNERMQDMVCDLRSFFFFFFKQKKMFYPFGVNEPRHDICP